MGQGTQETAEACPGSLLKVPWGQAPAVHVPGAAKKPGGVAPSQAGVVRTVPFRLSAPAAQGPEPSSVAAPPEE